MGAHPIDEASPKDEGFLFAGVRTMDDYRDLVRNLPLLRDRPEEREPLLELDRVLSALDAAKVRVPTPRTWRIALDAPIPKDLKYPLFVRTAKSSWKLGGQISKVRNQAELVAEMEALRRAIQWDAPILAREWVDLAPAGGGVYGKYPQEVRVWIIDGEPFAWSFHYLQALSTPAGFPPKPKDLSTLHEHAEDIAKAFCSRGVMADFAKLRSGSWIFIEAGPVSAAGTAHEGIFRAIATKLAMGIAEYAGDSVGGLF
jgi:ATP-grasp domain-containing protein